MEIEKLKIIFIGTPEFAIPSLKILIENDYEIVGVITAPYESPIKQFAQSHNLPVLQPTNLKDPKFIEHLKSLNADLQVVVAFRMLPEVVWSMPNLGTFNLHGSLLPNYRGAAPINWAIMNNEKVTGVTTFYIDDKIDTGDILLQSKMDIGSTESVGQLHDRMQIIGAELVLKTTQGIENKTLTKQPQPETEVKLAPKIYKKDCELDWTLPADQIYNKIRGLSPYPGAWSILKVSNGKEYNIKIFESELSDISLSPGDIHTDGKSLVVGCLDGSLSLSSVQISGKKRNNISDFLMGFRIDNSWKFQV